MIVHQSQPPPKKNPIYKLNPTDESGKLQKHKGDKKTTHKSQQENTMENNPELTPNNKQQRSPTETRSHVGELEGWNTEANDLLQKRVLKTLQMQDKTRNTPAERADQRAANLRIQTKTNIPIKWNTFKVCLCPYLARLAFEG